jgi:hypothetical protein
MTMSNEYSMDDRYLGLSIINFHSKWELIATADGAARRLLVVVFTLESVAKGMEKTTERTVAFDRETVLLLAQQIGRMAAESGVVDTRGPMEALMELARVENDPSILPADHPLVRFAYAALPDIDIHRNNWAQSIAEIVSFGSIREFLKLDVTTNARTTFRLSLHLLLAHLFVDQLEERIRD